MSKEILSDQQKFCMITIFIIGSSSIFVMGLEAGKDLWISIVLAFFMSIPVILLYGNLHASFPGQNLFDMCEICLGKWIGKFIILLFTWYTLDVTALNIRNYGQFIHVVALDSTPMPISMGIFIFLSIFALKSGIEVLGRWASFFLPIPIFITILIIFLLIPDMDLHHIYPILQTPFSSILKGAFELFSFPFAYIVVFPMVFSHFNNQPSHKIYLKSLLIGGLVILATSLTGLLVIGIKDASISYFPNYQAITRVTVGDSLQRLEILGSINFMLGGFIEISIYLLATCIGMSKLFNFQDYRFLVLPLGLIALNLASLEFDSIMEYYEWSFEVWPFYSFVFQVILPSLLLIAAKFYQRKTF
ncbi:GerAB/ArcD/ProY family transporter [Anaerophilus nitritogenes]|uniref:GerAB/ArcD/ProY family transporter n=1 Tax=Anaerophilus nitritogenes TaxID=2498136 RepID=UPI00101E0F0A|nr:endospore germination permease [Anaerophilus nitritogenes]